MALPIWENENMLVSKTTRRTWGARILTCPWQPFKATETHWCPSTSIYKMVLPGRLPFLWEPGRESDDLAPQRDRDRIVLMCHPVMARHIRESVKRDSRNFAKFVRKAKPGAIDFKPESPL